MPIFLLYGGEIVIAVLGLRVAWWIWRSRRQIPVLLSPPPGGDGIPSPRPRAPVVELARAVSAPAPRDETRRAA